LAARLDFRRGENRRQRQARAQSLRQREDVRNDGVAGEREHFAGAAEAGLRLVDDQHHAAVLAAPLELGKIARRQVEDTVMAFKASARPMTGSDSIPLNRWSRVTIDRCTVSTMAGCEWPRIALICPEVKSSTRQPRAS
jgi:hypothetical protein